MPWKKTAHWLVVSLLAIALLSSFSLQYLFPIQQAYADITNGAIAAYKSNTGVNSLGSPKVRLYDNTADTFGSEIELSNTGSNVRDAKVKCSPVSAKCVVVSLSVDGTLNSWSCTSGCGAAGGWTGNFGADFADLWTTEPTGADRPFDIAYEDSSGDLLVVYDKVSTTSAEELFYRVMTDAGTTFGSETAIDTQTANSVTDRVYGHVILASDDGSDKIGRVETDISNSDVNAAIWSGSAWGDNAAVTASSTATHDEHLGIAWETNSGHLLTVGGAGTDIAGREYTTSWQTAANIGGVATGVGTVNWISMKPTPRSAGNEIFLAFSGTLNDFASIQWSGTAWGTGTEHDAAILGVDDHRNFDIATSPAADGDSATVDALLVWDTTANQIDYRSWSATNTYGTASSVAYTANQHSWLTFAYLANPTSGDTVDNLGTVHDVDLDIGRIEWSGGANAPTVGADELTVATGTGGIAQEGSSVDWFYNAFTSNQFNADPTLGITVAPTTDGIALYLKGIAQAVSVSPAVDGIASYLKAISQGFSLSPVTTGIPNYLKAISESISLSPSVTQFVNYVRAISETLSFVIDIDTIAFLIIGISQSIGVADAVDGIVNYMIALTQGFSLSDSVSAVRAFFANLTLNFTVADSVAYLREVFVNLAVGINLADSVNRMVALSISITQNFTLDTSIERLREIFVSLTQGITVDSTIERIFGVLRLLNDAFSVTDNVQKGLEIIRNISQGINLGHLLNFDTDKTLCDFASLISALLRIPMPC